MDIRARDTDRELLLEFSGEMDHHGARNALKEVEIAIDAALPRSLILDFAGVTFMDSSGIALILRSQQRMQLMEGSVVLRNVPEQARRVLDAAGIGRLVSIQYREVYIMKIKTENEVTLQFPSQSSNEGFIRSAVACFAAQMDPTLNELEDIKTAVSEAATNAIVHAYPDRIGKVTVKVRICTGQVLEITVRDYGRGIPDVEKARQPMFTTGGEERSGMGFTIMESFMDSLKVRSVAGRGTTVVMKKKIAPRIKR